DPELDVGSAVPSADESACGLLEELRRQTKRLLIDALVVPMEHLGEVLERDPLAHETVPVRRHALPPKIPRISRADDQERDRLRAGDELLRDLRECVPKRRV